ncbi:hypothetical protein NDU88_008209 [Pleurodeles waltl]|uniref:Uncharacterized protein n=1 Tax=Pleurodeles waltl TaxID=8319 RepID=A0AAV7RW81_PLEWA|nr:hypothetical protein NDU88_008209 [Pleurodeles waltl]
MVEGDVVACGEDGVKGVTGCVGGCVDELCEAEIGEVFGEGGGVGVIVVFVVEVQVPEEDVVREGECVVAGKVGDGVAERCPGSWGSIDECSSERGAGVRTDLEVKEFGGAEGVVQGGFDFEGGFVDDGYASTVFVGAVSASDFVSVRDGYGDVGC